MRMAKLLAPVALGVALTGGAAVAQRPTDSGINVPCWEI